MKKSRMIAVAAVAAMSASALALSAGAYNAYIGLQTNNYSFRNDWTEANYGKATPYFNSWIVWGGDDLDETYPDYADYYNFDIGDKGGYVLPATYTDATVDTDGTYTVKAETSFGIRDDDTDFGLCFISTDLPADQGIVIKNAKISIDGNVVKTVDECTYDESAQYIQVQFANQWNADLGFLGAGFPTKSVAIEFTVEGLASDAAAAAEAPKDEAPAETTAAPATAGDTAAATDSSKGSPDTGIADVAVIGGLALAAGAGIALTRKRK